MENSLFIKELSNIWNNYINNFDIITDSQYVKAAHQICESTHTTLIVIQDPDSNIICFDRSIFTKSKSIPEFFIMEDDQLVGFDVNCKTRGFYPNQKFMDMYQDTIQDKPFPPVVSDAESQQLEP